MSNQEHLESMGEDDTLLFETSICSIELMCDDENWPIDLVSLGDEIARAADISFDFAQSRAGSSELSDTSLELPKANPHINILLTSDDNIRQLNMEFRGKDQPTNVLSFPVGDDSALGPAADMIIGDIVLGHETVAREARDRNVPINDHITHLAVHGVLHLLGYDHQDDDEAQLMEGLETRILAKMNISDPYEPGTLTDESAHATSGEQ